MTKGKFLLLKLIEECAEVSQRASKQIQFGTHETQGNGSPSNDTAPETRLTNQKRLLSEVSDLVIIVELLVEVGELPSENDMPDFEEAKAKKIEKLNKYLAYSRQLGEIGGEWTI